MYSATAGLESDTGEMKILRQRLFGSLRFWGQHRLFKNTFVGPLHQRYKQRVCTGGFEAGTVFFSSLGRTLCNGCLLM